jgi:alpha-mannosidase
VLAEAEDLNLPLPARPARGAGSLRPLSVEGLPVALGALKPLEEGGGLLLRVYEPQGRSGRVQLTGSAAEAGLDLLERETGPPDLELGPFAVRTWRLR